MECGTTWPKLDREIPEEYRTLIMETAMVANARDKMLGLNG